NIDAICSIQGVDAIFVGPNDLLASMHKTPAMETDDPLFVGALLRIREACDWHGVAPGIHVADAAMAKRRMAEGWRFIAIASELGFMQNGAKAAADAIG